MMFAKLYEPTPGNQVLVTLTRGDDGPMLSIFCEPEGLGVCSSNLYWNDNDDGWDKAEKALAEMTEETAVSLTTTMREFGKDFSSIEDGSGPKQVAIPVKIRDQKK